VAVSTGAVGRGLARLPGSAAFGGEAWGGPAVGAGAAGGIAPVSAGWRPGALASGPAAGGSGAAPGGDGIGAGASVTRPAGAAGAGPAGARALGAGPGCGRFVAVSSAGCEVWRNGPKATHPAASSARAATIQTIGRRVMAVNIYVTLNAEHRG
jgi:hypothetical protein